jgi:hypothetical protein
MKDDLEMLLEKIQLARDALDEAAQIISKIPLEPRKDNIILIGKALAEIAPLERKIYQLRPELEKIDDVEPDPQITTEDLDTIARKLSAEDLKSVDDFILERCSREFRKVARIVGGKYSAPHGWFPRDTPSFLCPQNKLFDF